MNVRTIPVTAIAPDPHQPRKLFDEKALGELAESISEHGLIQPITVTAGLSDGQFNIVTGERRWRASKLAGLAELPCIVRDKQDGATTRRIQLIENIQRENMSFVEEAEAVGEIVADCGGSQANAARQIGKSQVYVSHCMRILRYPPEVLELIHRGKLTKDMTVAHDIQLLPAEQQVAVARQAVEQRWTIKQIRAHVQSLVGDDMPRRKSRKTTGDTPKRPYVSGGRNAPAISEALGDERSSALPEDVQRHVLAACKVCPFWHSGRSDGVCANCALTCFVRLAGALDC